MRAKVNVEFGAVAFVIGYVALGIPLSLRSKVAGTGITRCTLRPSPRSGDWQCQQLQYNPRKIESFGRRDGEGRERLWSKLVKLIRLRRRANASLRFMNLHFKVDEIMRVRERIWGGVLVLLYSSLHG